MQISRKISESSPGTKPLRKDSLLSKQAMLVPASDADFLPVADAIAASYTAAQ